MAKRNFRDNADDPFGGDTESTTDSWQTTDSLIFGSPLGDDLAAVDSQRRIRRVDIFKISPDLSQPRRTMPSVIRSAWNGQPETLQDVFGYWVEAVEIERNSGFDVGLYLTQSTEHDISERSLEDSEYAAGPLESSLLQVVTLAASIRRDGLTNPVTVASAKKIDHFLLETGERRWLAYHLLWSWFDGSEDDRPNERDDWQQIPAREVEVVNVWRQANENNARADLNAIGKARQYAVLMMDLLEDSINLKPFTHFKNEQLYYAQVKDARVPSGKGEQLLTAMGVSNRSTLSRYRRLLDLPTEIWQTGDDQNMPEEQLYNLANIAVKKSPELALKRFEEIVAGRNISTNSEEHGPGTKRHFTTLSKAILSAGKGKDEINQKALQAMEELRIWLEQQEERIRTYLE